MEDKSNDNLAEALAKVQQEKIDAEAKLAEEVKKRNQAEAALINFRPAPSDVVLKDPAEYAKTLKEASSMTNREYWQTSINFRDASLKKYGKDVWSDTGIPTEQTTKIAGSIKQLLEECPSDEEFRLKLNYTLVDARAVKSFRG